MAQGMMPKRVPKTPAEMVQVFRDFAPDLKHAQFQVHRDSNPDGWAVVAMGDPSEVIALNTRLQQVWTELVDI